MHFRQKTKKCCQTNNTFEPKKIGRGTDQFLCYHKIDKLSKVVGAHFRHKLKSVAKQHLPTTKYNIWQRNAFCCFMNWNSSSILIFHKISTPSQNGQIKESSGGCSFRRKVKQLWLQSRGNLKLHIQIITVLLTNLRTKNMKK